MGKVFEKHAIEIEGIAEKVLPFPEFSAAIDQIVIELSNKNIYSNSVYQLLFNVATETSSNGVTLAEFRSLLKLLTSKGIFSCAFS